MKPRRVGETSRVDEPGKEQIVVGVVAAPGAAAELAEQVAPELCEALGARFPEYEWHATVVVERLGEPPVAPLVEIVEATRAKLLQEDWDIALGIADQPLRVGRQPVRDYSSPTHRVGVVSLPGLGARDVHRRLRDALVDQVEELLGAEGDEHAASRPVRIAAGERPGPGFPLAVVLANARLVIAMVRANEPWRFALRLYRVLVTAIATAVFALITAEAWELADAAGWPRLLAASLIAVVIVVGVVIAAHGLWERAPNPRVRQDVVLFNLATTLTVTFGVATLYLALFAVAFGASYLFVDEDVIEGVVRREVGPSSYLTLAWLLASIATLGGALGAGIESAEAIREAAYAPLDEDDETRSDEADV